MEEKGVELSDVNVDSGQQDERYQSQEEGGRAAGSGDDDIGDELLGNGTSNDQVASSVSTNLVDYFV